MARAPYGQRDVVVPEVCTWSEHAEGCRALAARVAADGWQPDVLVAVGRGGMIVAGTVAHALGVQNCGVMNVALHRRGADRVPMPVMLPPPLHLVDVADMRVLVCDDVVGTGGTLATVRDYLREKVADVRCAALYQNVGSTVDCEYAWRRTDRWVTLPWTGGRLAVDDAAAEAAVDDAADADDRVVDLAVLDAGVAGSRPRA